MNERALQILQGLPTLPIHIIIVAGIYRRGKSALLNHLAKTVGIGFELGHDTQGKTSGFDCILMKHWTDADAFVLIIDSEGTDDSTKDEQRTTHILVLAWLLCSTFVYNTQGVPDRGNKDLLQAAAVLANKVVESFQDQGFDDGAKDCRPSLTWVVRDWHHDIAGGKDFNTYLEEDILRTECGISTQSKKAYESGQQLRKLFPLRQMVGVPRPVVEETDLQNLESPDVQLRLKPEFKRMMLETCRLIMEQSRPKALPGGRQLLGGPLLVEFLEQVAQALTPGVIPNIEDTWSRVKKALGQRGLHAATLVFDGSFAAARERLQRRRFDERSFGAHLLSSHTAVPLEIVELEDARGSAMTEAEAKLLEELRGCCDMTDDAVQSQLTQHGIVQLREALGANLQCSKRYCELLAEEVCAPLMAELKKKDKEDCEFLQGQLASASE
eukprot:4595298-Amphidinium_carterae.1